MPVRCRAYANLHGRFYQSEKYLRTVKQIIGNLTDTERVMAGLDLNKTLDK
jgi:hypothetical protein